MDKISKTSLRGDVVKEKDPWNNRKYVSHKLYEFQFPYLKSEGISIDHYFSKKFYGTLVL